MSRTCGFVPPTTLYCIRTLVGKSFRARTEWEMLILFSLAGNTLHLYNN